MSAKWLESPSDQAPFPAVLPCSLHPVILSLQVNLLSLGFPTIDLNWGRRLLRSQGRRPDGRSLFGVCQPAGPFRFLIF